MVALLAKVGRIASDNPVAVRGLVIAVLDLLVAGGVVDTGLRKELELVILGALNLVLIRGAHMRVTPISKGASPGA